MQNSLLKLETLGPVFISGPMSNIPNYNRIAFSEAELLLSNMYIPYISPWNIKYNDIVRLKDGYCLVLAQCISLLAHCNAILMLDGWHSSPGSLLEREFARTCGIPVFYINDILEECTKSNK